MLPHDADHGCDLGAAGAAVCASLPACPECNESREEVDRLLHEGNELEAQRGAGIRAA